MSFTSRFYRLMFFYFHILFTHLQKSVVQRQPNTFNLCYFTHEKNPFLFSYSLIPRSVSLDCKLLKNDSNRMKIQEYCTLNDLFLHTCRVFYFLCKVTVMNLSLPLLVFSDFLHFQFQRTSCHNTCIPNNVKKDK